MVTNPETETETTAKKPSRVFVHIARVLMGLAFLAFGLMGILMALGVMKAPETNMSEDIKMVNGALAKAGYMNVVSWTMAIVGVLLLINRFVPLALALIAPILVGILTFHINMQPAGIIPGAVVSLLELYVAWSYRNAFCPMLRAKVTPGVRCE